MFGCIAKAAGAARASGWMQQREAMDSRDTGIKKLPACCRRRYAVTSTAQPLEACDVRTRKRKSLCSREVCDERLVIGLLAWAWRRRSRKV
jgi:hypothetical protein